MTVGDGAAIQKNEAVQQFVPKDLSELVATINTIRLPDRLYAKMFRTTSGMVIGTSEMPNLPPSVLATMNNDRVTGGLKPSVQSVIKVSEVPPAKFVITPNAPVRQIWISALSTSFKLDWSEAVQNFILEKTGESLKPLMARLVNEQLGEEAVRLN